MLEIAQRAKCRISDESKREDKREKKKIALFAPRCHLRVCRGSLLIFEYWKFSIVHTADTTKYILASKIKTFTSLFSCKFYISFFYLLNLPEKLLYFIFKLPFFPYSLNVGCLFNFIATYPLIEEGGGQLNHEA